MKNYISLTNENISMIGGGMEKGRRSIRMKGYDYSKTGTYFVTICTQNKECLFGKVVDGKVRLNKMGLMVKKCWVEIPSHFPNMELDEFVVMPNHVHGIIIISDANSKIRAKNLSPLREYVPIHQPPGTSKTIGSVVRGFKIGVSKWLRQNSTIHKVWQRNYYEHVVRNENEMNLVREYICNNPLKWQLDRENPNYKSSSDSHHEYPNHEWEQM